MAVINEEIGEKGLENFKIISIYVPQFVWELIEVDEDLLPLKMKLFDARKFPFSIAVVVFLPAIITWLERKLYWVRTEKGKRNAGDLLGKVLILIIEKLARLNDVWAETLSASRELKFNWFCHENSQKSLIRLANIHEDK